MLMLKAALISFWQLPTSSAAAANTDALTNNGAIETLHNKLRSR
jgi:hypothetical protein